MLGMLDLLGGGMPRQLSSKPLGHAIRLGFFDMEQDVLDIGRSLKDTWELSARFPAYIIAALNRFE